MKVSQLRSILEAAEQLYRDGGNSAAAQSLKEVATLCTSRDAMPVSRFVGAIAKAMAAENAQNEQ